MDDRAILEQTGGIAFTLYEGSPHYQQSASRTSEHDFFTDFVPASVSVRPSNEIYDENKPSNPNSLELVQQSNHVNITSTIENDIQIQDYFYEDTLPVLALTDPYF
jgi:hypothetical protein